MSKIRKVPMRTCIGCREQKPKKDLIRVVKDKENKIFIDKTGKANGRGAYLCNDKNCLEKAIKSKALNRAFTTEISEEVYENLINSVE
ncbi:MULTISPECIES: RNase P modulator RnpM [Peptoniphilus]|uniref:RNase P modulator RnpM n=1 Tax=Peptoniphilus TaxID=162289 RepID=UPI000288F6C1|nr:MULTISPECIES: YlxR family protein [Peptoniphilus]MBS6609987.1 YlxR family protein [Peptoniphilus harei]MDU1043522.1 YlxR family protein [Peptoniphilus rhinitidis]MDU1954237.1 YlxR family protein [Peptoniphilus lacydonensis]MDU2115596.1 YlxR family protein [Peptoniphilus lacydonensis]MDU3751740.1 YlxR family protein [Peptoniphilus rhinitidis]